MVDHLRAAPRRARARSCSRSTTSSSCSSAPAATRARSPEDRSSTTVTVSPLLEQRVDHVRADEAGPAGDDRLFRHSGGKSSAGRGWNGARAGCRASRSSTAWTDSSIRSSTLRRPARPPAGFPRRRGRRARSGSRGGGSAGRGSRSRPSPRSSWTMSPTTTRSGCRLVDGLEQVLGREAGVEHRPEAGRGELVVDHLQGRACGSPPRRSRSAPAGGWAGRRRSCSG